MTQPTTSSPDDASSENWTDERRAALQAMLGHVLPYPGPDEPQPVPRSEVIAATTRYVLQQADRPPLIGVAPFILATLDEAIERCDGPLGDLDGPGLEALLRGLESDPAPVFAHGLGLILRAGLEGLLGDPEYGPNVNGAAWQGLGIGSDGMRLQARPVDDKISKDSES